MTADLGQRELFVAPHVDIAHPAAQPPGAAEKFVATGCRAPPDCCDGLEGDLGFPKPERVALPNGRRPGAMTSIILTIHAGVGQCLKQLSSAARGRMFWQPGKRRLTVCNSYTRCTER